MIWKRDEAQPTRYGEITFRSALEAKTAEQLDHLNVQWTYETPVDGVDWYLPDFTIAHADIDLDLPMWVEVKPADLLYALRDHVGCPEHFDGTMHADVTAQQMHAAQLTEIWKPKYLAETTGECVLVVYQINRTRSLSVLMAPSGIELSKSHPAVNHRGVTLKRKRDEEHAKREAFWARRRTEIEQQDAQMRATLHEQARQHGRPARFDGPCRSCRQLRPAADLVVFPEEGYWIGVCRSHLIAQGAPA